ncbi:MAG TPA: N-acetylneuraminate synthase family protein [Planctomycetota bacterium]|nr:N-acetylneuraminate synthase family protein [Planctomycetota bacterium]
MSIQAGKRAIGAGEPCFIAAEIGINHNGDVELARRMIAAAAEAGADAVKFQNYRTEDFISDRSLVHRYVSRGREVVESQYELFKRCELSTQALTSLAKFTREQGLEFFSTPTSETGIDELVAAGATLVKNGSDFLTHLPLIRAMAKSGLPCVISTGMATIEEIDDAVYTFRAAGGRGLVLLHCTSSYPTAAKDVHLRKLPALATSFHCPVGLSDHTLGIQAALGAVALGAVFVEKHFTTDRDLPGPDQAMSCDPAELRELVQGIRALEAMLGSPVIGPTPAEAASRASFRLSCVARKDMAAGTTLEPASIAFRRPGTGFPPKALEWISGRALTRPVQSGAVLDSEDFT